MTSASKVAGGSVSQHVMQSGKPHFIYIDCVRGYAILMVMACHLTYEFAGLPYPVHRLTTSGWFGVQLFFLASAITLLMSWNAEKVQRKPDVRAFFIRRFFRIAPAYYLAGILYFIVMPPPHFSLLPVVLTGAFINAFHPAWLTVPGAWNVVPGGWSISVEFTFYALFPLFASLVTSLRRALYFLFFSIIFGFAANVAAYSAFAANYDPVSLSNFLFFWFPNEISIFAIGGVTFFVLTHFQSNDRLGMFLARWSMLLAVVCCLGFCTLAYCPFPLGHYLGAGPVIPAGQAASIPLAGFIVALSAQKGGFVNRPIAAMGKVSFSAYLLHFAVLRIFPAFPAELHTGSTGVQAIMFYGIGFAIFSIMTFCASWLSYKLIEAPMIKVGRRLIYALQRAPGHSLSPA